VTAHFKTLKAQVAQFLQVAEREQALTHLVRDIPVAALADLDATKIRMPEREIAAQVAYTAAQRAVWVAGKVRTNDRKLVIRIPSLCNVGDFLESLVYFALCHVLLPSSRAKWLPRISNSACYASRLRLLLPLSTQADTLSRHP